MQNGQHIITVLSLFLWRVNLNPKAKVKQLLRAIPVTNQVVKWREQRRAWSPVTGLHLFQQRNIGCVNVPVTGPVLPVILSTYPLDQPIVFQVFQHCWQVWVTPANIVPLDVRW